MRTDWMRDLVADLPDTAVKAKWLETCDDLDAAHEMGVEPVSRCSPDHPCPTTNFAHVLLWGECFVGDRR